MICQQCGYEMEAFDSVCRRCQATAPTGPVRQAQFIETARLPVLDTPAPAGMDVAEIVRAAKLAIKDLKLQKKEQVAGKKMVTSQIAQKRAEHRSRAAHSTSPVRLPGTFGKVMRGVERASKVAMRAQLDNAIRPQESEKLEIEKQIALIDRRILELERYVLENS